MRYSSTAVSVAAVGGLVLTGPAADAALVDSFTEPVQDSFTATCEGPDGEFDIDGTVTGTETLKFRTRGDGAYPYFDAHRTVLQTLTNPDTGRSWTALDENHEHDVKILSQTGNILQVQVQYSFRFTVFDEAGDVDSYNRGSSTFVIEVDTQGTPTYEDDEGFFVEELRSSGPRTTRDFCEDALRFTVE